MQKLHITWVLTAFASLLTPIPVAADAENTVLPRWEFSEGQRFQYRLSREHKDGWSLKGEKPVSMDEDTLTLTCNWEVTEVLPDGSAEIKSDIEVIKIEEDWGSLVDSDGFSFDSSAERITHPSEYHRLIQSLLETTATFVISPRGQVTQLTFPDSIVSLSRKLPDKAEIHICDFESILGNDPKKCSSVKFAREIVSPALFVLPALDVSQGESWRIRESQLLGSQTLTHDATLTFDGWKTGPQDRSCAAIRIELDRSLNNGDLRIKSQQFQGKLTSCFKPSQFASIKIVSATTLASGKADEIQMATNELLDIEVREIPASIPD